MNCFEYLKGMTVLLAEDDEIISNSLVNGLELFVSQVIAVDNGISALEVFNRGHIDIVILDIGMPKLSGIDVAQKIRETDSGTPIFIITSFEDTERLRHAIPLMLVDYLIKPLKFDQIQTALIKSVEYIDRHDGLSCQIDSQTTYNPRSGKIFHSTGTSVTLPKRERQLLDLLLKNKTRLLTKSFLEESLFEMECTESSLKNLVYRLKKKLPANSIRNIRDIGYMLVAGK